MCGTIVGAHVRHHIEADAPLLVINTHAPRDQCMLSLRWMHVHRSWMPLDRMLPFSSAGVQQQVQQQAGLVHNGMHGCMQPGMQSGMQLHAAGMDGVMRMQVC